MFRNMVTSLLKHERIRTTDAKAKELRRWADNLITLAKRGDLHARRQALSIVREKDVVHKLFAEAAERYGAVSGGYTRVVKLGRRPGDAAPVSLVELISPEKPKKKKTKKKKKEKIAIEKDTHVEETAAAEAAESVEADIAEEVRTAEPEEDKTEETAEAAESESISEEKEQVLEEAIETPPQTEETMEAEPETTADDTQEDPEARK